MQVQSVWSELKKEVGNPLIIIPVLSIFFLAPAFIFRHRIRFLPEVFVTEWMKTFAETVLLVIVARSILIIRDRTRVRHQDMDVLEQHLLVFLRLCGTKLSGMATATDTDRIALYGEARLCWIQASRYISSQAFLDLKSQQLVLWYIKLVNHQATVQSLRQVSSFFSEPDTYETPQLDFINSSVNTLVKQFEKKPEHGDPPAL